MATLRQAIARHVELGEIPTGDISVRGLLRQFQPVPKGSIRALQAAMFNKVSRKCPWAVILCRFKGEAANSVLEQPIEKFYSEAFTPGTGGLIEYWRDVTLGAIDITGTKVFGWVELEITRAKAGIASGVGRKQMADFAIAAVKRAGQDPVSGFFNQIAIITQNWSKDDVPGGTNGGPDWTNPNDPRAPFWIDGSEDGVTGLITLTPPHDGNISAHEMGHTLGMQHDVGADLITHYADPCCIMSQQSSFTHPTWNVNFGPALCLPHLMQRQWMYTDRVFHAGGDWLSLPGGITFTLASIIDPGARANLGVALTNRNANPNWDYILEYARPAAWNQGLSNNFLFIRRIGPGKDVGPTPIILGQIAVPGAVGTKAELVEPSGKVRFQVERLDPEGRIVQVNAKKA